MRMRAKGALGDWVKRRRVRKYEELIGKTRISWERGLERTVLPTEGDVPVRGSDCGWERKNQGR
jgi:hypothetical protein